MGVGASMKMYDFVYEESWVLIPPDFWGCVLLFVPVVGIIMKLPKVWKQTLISIRVGGSKLGTWDNDNPDPNKADVEQGGGDHKTIPAAAAPAAASEGAAVAAAAGANTGGGGGGGGGGTTRSKILTAACYAICIGSTAAGLALGIIAIKSVTAGYENQAE